eukprot:TRINITY_DN506_c1_g1_i2.p2 TRINITY_DN506_c1_g1~~TRINITY_DN506_c1_g1_i2.p2  ORF type:complete len:128 (+),score=37.87 TRINITY_DN506_c1_g1_i2:196-579(+)
MSNPIDSNWGGNSNRPSQYASSPGSPTMQSLKNAGGKAADKAKEGAGKCYDCCCAPEVKKQLGELITYTATIIIALAWWELISQGIFYRIFDSELWWMWVLATVLIILAMVICWLTGEALAFGEDCC